MLQREEREKWEERREREGEEGGKEREEWEDGLGGSSSGVRRSPDCASRLESSSSSGGGREQQQERAHKLRFGSP